MELSRDKEIDNAIEVLELPLYCLWERMAAKELSTILNGICSGGFDSPDELRERLWELITELHASFDCSD